MSDGAGGWKGLWCLLWFLVLINPSPCSLGFYTSSLNVDEAFLYFFECFNDQITIYSSWRLGFSVLAELA